MILLEISEIGLQFTRIFWIIRYDCQFSDLVSEALEFLSESVLQHWFFSRELFNYIIQVLEFPLHLQDRPEHVVVIWLTQTESNLLIYRRRICSISILLSIRVICCWIRLSLVILISNSLIILLISLSCLIVIIIACLASLSGRRILTRWGIISWGRILSWWSVLVLTWWRSVRVLSRWRGLRRDLILLISSILLCLISRRYRICLNRWLFLLSVFCFSCDIFPDHWLNEVLLWCIKLILFNFGLIHGHFRENRRTSDIIQVDSWIFIHELETLNCNELRSNTQIRSRYTYKSRPLNRHLSIIETSLPSILLPHWHFEFVGGVLDQELCMFFVWYFLNTWIPESIARW